MDPSNNLPATAPGHGAAPAPPPVETVGLLRASVRCWHFGLGGLVPVLGIGLAYEALRLGGQLLERTGERWDWQPVLRFWAVGTAALAVAQWAGGLTAILLVWAVLLAAWAALVIRRYQHGCPLIFNAARRHVFAGLGLALAGLVTSVLAGGLLLGRLKPDY